MVAQPRHEPARSSARSDLAAADGRRSGPAACCRHARSRAAAGPGAASATLVGDLIGALILSGKVHRHHRAPERRIILAVNTFHSASTAGPQHRLDDATTPEGNSATTPPSFRWAMALARISTLLRCASGSWGNGTGIMKLPATSSIQVSSDAGQDAIIRRARARSDRQKSCRRPSHADGWRPPQRAVFRDAVKLRCGVVRSIPMVSSAARQKAWPEALPRFSN